MNITIKKANLKSGIFLSYSYSRTANDVKNNISENPDAVIHDDLKIAFRNCIPFFAHICDEVLDEGLIQKAIDNPQDYCERVEDDAVNDKNPFLKYSVNGFEIGGKDDAEAVKLFGNKWLTIGDVIGLHTPMVKLDGSYKFSTGLADAIGVLKSEVFAYMEGKQAPKQHQLGFEFNEEDEQENFE